MTLTPSQLAVVNATEPYLLVSATAGAGKSRVLVERIKRLVRDGADPTRIVVIVYTNAAAAVLQERLGEVRLGTNSTLHAWLFSLLSRHGHLIGLDGQLSVVDEDAQADLLAEAVKDMSYRGTLKELTAEVAKGPGERSKPLTKAGLAAEAFFQRLAADRILTFDMILSHGLRLLEAQPGVADADYLFVDEAQDLTEQDWRIIEANGIPNIFTVGDGDQRLYSFRGASDGFEKRCKGISDRATPTRKLYEH